MFHEQIRHIEQLQTKLVAMEAAMTVTTIQKNEQSVQTEHVAADVVKSTLTTQEPLTVVDSAAANGAHYADMVDKSTDALSIIAAVDCAAQTDDIKIMATSVPSPIPPSPPPAAAIVIQNQVDCDAMEENAMLAAGDIAMLTDPNVEREEELVAFKEECSRLQDDNLYMKNQISEMQSRLRSGPRMSQNAMYIAPLIAIIGYLLISPYL